MKDVKIAVVEDDIEIADILKLAFSKEGYKSVTFNTSEKLLNSIIEYKENYDLVIFDVMLPGMNGKDACKLLRAKNIDVPILILTALATEEDKVSGLDSGADDYITKPFSIKELLARVRALLRRNKTFIKLDNSFAEHILFFDDFRTVEIKGNKIYLTNAEFIIFKTLVDRSGQAVRKDELSIEIGSKGSVRTIDVHVKNLREKLGDEGNKIKTVWGVGYKFEP